MTSRVTSSAYWPLSVTIVGNSEPQHRPTIGPRRQAFKATGNKLPGLTVPALTVATQVRGGIDLPRPMLVARTGVATAASFGLESEALRIAVTNGGPIQTLLPLTQPRALRLDDLSIRPETTSIISFANGVSSFVEELSALNFRAVAVDPCYSMSPSQLAAQANADVGSIRSNVVRANPALFHSGYRAIVADGSEPAMKRRSAQRCTADLAVHPERYHAQALPHVSGLPKSTLGVIGHFLFLYDHLPYMDEKMHVDSILNALDFCDELRVYPLFNTSNQLSRHLRPACKTLAARGYGTEIHDVCYASFARSHKMLVIKKKV